MKANREDSKSKEVETEACRRRDALRSYFRTMLIMLPGILLLFVAFGVGLGAIKSVVVELFGEASVWWVFGIGGFAVILLPSMGAMWLAFATEPLLSCPSCGAEFMGRSARHLYQHCRCQRCDAFVPIEQPTRRQWTYDWTIVVVVWATVICFTRWAGDLLIQPL